MIVSFYMLNVDRVKFIRQINHIANKKEKTVTDKNNTNMASFKSILAVLQESGDLP